VFLPYGTGTYVGSDGLQPNGQRLGTNNPSSVILNGMPTSGLGTGVAYVDPTPAVLTDNPTNPRFTRFMAASSPAPPRRPAAAPTTR
jgi:hypothetical protein